MMQSLQLQYPNMSWVLLGALLLVTRLAWKVRRTILVSIRTFKRDIQLVHTLVVKSLPSYLRKLFSNETIFKSLDNLCQSKGSRSSTCFFYEHEKWTFGQVQSMSFQVANFFQGQGYKKGDVVALSMHNRPETMCIWLGLSRIGVTTALINFNLHGKSLEHCINISKCKAFIFGSELREEIQKIHISQSQNSEGGIVFYELDRYFDIISAEGYQSNISAHSDKDSFSKLKTNDLSVLLRNASVQPTKLHRKDQEPQFFDTLLYIYTSGTTGMPKAARITHSKLTISGTVGGRFIFCQRGRDIIYCPLPLYHSMGLFSVAIAFTHGIPVVIVRKFSAQKFWSDIHYYKATICMYLGEFCRFLLHLPSQPELETGHSLRTMVGLGAKPEVWQSFRKRYNIEKFMECYGSTEGNCTLLNIEATQVGACGYIPPWSKPIYSLKIIKVDEVTGEITRDKETGLAVICEDNEPGELVGKITNIFPSLRFDGYTNEEETKKKVAHNVAKRGDRYFRTGDLFTLDEYGYFYFKDRIGDTFRWKGENVSTAEVEGVILSLTDMKTNIVYGVEVPGTEGKAGMASILDADGTLDLKTLGEGLERELPIYARPKFIRVINDENGINMTGTFKLQKFNLQQQGYNIESISDPIFIYDPALRNYKPLEMDVYKQLMLGSCRL